MLEREYSDNRFEESEDYSEYDITRKKKKGKKKSDDFEGLDENTIHAIKYRLQRQKHSDFYVKLSILSERI